MVGAGTIRKCFGDEEIRDLYRRFGLVRRGGSAFSGNSSGYDSV